MKRNVIRIAIFILLLFAIRLAFDAAPRDRPKQRDLSAVERAMATGKIAETVLDEGGLSVWAPDFPAIEPELKSAVISDDEQIRLMHGQEQVGEYSKRAGITLRKQP